MKNSLTKKLIALLMMLCLVLPVSGALADREDAAEMAAYWKLVGDPTRTDPLTRAMNGDYAALPQTEKVASLTALKAVTVDELLAFAAESKLPVDMARYSYYTALAECLAADIALGEETPVTRTLSLFLAMKNKEKDSDANKERKSLRKTLSEADVKAYAAETGLPAGFLAWLLLDDEWHELDWEDGDDWREGRRDWDIPDWVDASDLREKYGKDAVVTEDDVERTLRENGYRFDD